MNKKALFEQIGGIMHGGDYNPEQWLDRPDILEQDIILMKSYGMTIWGTRVQHSFRLSYIGIS